MQIGQTAPLSPGRLFWAFVLAPAAPALAVGLIATSVMVASSPGGFWVGCVAAAVTYAYFGLPPALILGLPAYFLLKRQVALNAGWTIAVGAALPAVWLLLFNAISGLLHPDTVVHRGLPGESEWPSLLAFFAIVAMLGAVGGWFFWLIAAWRPGRVSART